MRKKGILRFDIYICIYIFIFIAQYRIKFPTYRFSQKYMISILILYIYIFQLVVKEVNKMKNVITTTDCIG